MPVVNTQTQPLTQASSTTSTTMWTSVRAARWILPEKFWGNYKVRVQNVRLEFLQNITKESLNFLAGQKLQERQKMNLDDVIAESMKSVVDEVFTTLEPYILEFNKAVACTQLSCLLH